MSEEKDVATLVPGFEKPNIGDVCAIDAVDWGSYEGAQLPTSMHFSIVYATIYGKIVAVDDDQIVLAMQVFFTGGIRGVLAIPWVTVTKVVILERVDEIQ